VLDTSFKLYRASFAKSTLLSLIYLFLLVAPYAVYLAVLMRAMAGPSAPEEFLVSSGVMFVCSIVAGAIYLGIVHQVDATGHGAADRSLGDSIATGFKRLLPLIWTAIVMAVVLIGAALPAAAAAALLNDLSPLAGGIATLVLALLPLALAVYLMFAFVLVVTDRESGIRAVRHSYNLVKGNWWRVFLIVTVVMIIYSIISGVFAALGGFLLGLTGGMHNMVGPMLGALGAYILFIVFQVLLTPYLFSGLLAILEDLKHRREGSDLEARLAG